MFTDDTIDDEILDDDKTNEAKDDDAPSKTFEDLKKILEEMLEKQTEDGEENLDEMKIFNDEITPVVRNAIMITLAKVTQGLTLTKEKNRTETESAVYSIKSKESEINTRIIIDDETYDSTQDFRAIVEYAFNENDFVADEMNDEREIIENVTRFFNGFILNLKEEEQIIEEHQEYSKEYLTTSFHDYYTRARTELTTLLYNSGNLSDNEYYTLICARYLLDNIIEETIFFCGSEMLDFLNATVNLTKAFPLFEDGQIELHNLCKYVYDNESN